jgi:hypothetical protein
MEFCPTSFRMPRPLAERWAALVTGGIFTALFAGYERWRGKPVAWSTYVRIFVVFGFVAASFSAWRDEHSSKINAGGTEDLNLKSPNLPCIAGNR